MTRHHSRRALSRSIGVSAALALVLAACGSDDGSGSADDGDRRAPVLVEIGAVGGSGASAASGSAEALASDGAVDRMSPAIAGLSFWAAYEYQVSDDLPALPTADTGYEFPADATVDADAVARLAAALGVEGEPERGGGREVDGVAWRVGPDDGTARSLVVFDDGQLSWYLSSAWAIEIQPFEGSVEGPVEGSVDADESSRADDEWPVYEPPVGVPSEAEAEVLVAALLAELGVSPDAVEFETVADEWSASVTVWTLRDGMRWPSPAWFGFGGEAELQWAGGALAQPIATGPYPLIDLDEALARLDRQNGWWSAASGPGDLPASDVAVDAMPVDDMPVDDMPVAPMEEMEPIVAVLVDVRADLWWVWDIDGSVWLLPAYTFIDADGGWHTVPAVTDEFISFDQFDDSVPLPEPAPVDPEPGVAEPGLPEPVDPDPVDPGEDAVDPAAPWVVAVIGLDVDAATAALAADGASLRVVREEGVDLPATMDYRPDRVNVAVLDGVVTGIVSVG